MTLPPCGARHDIERDKGVFFCAHPRVLSKHFIVTAGFCRMCPLKDLPLPETLRPFRLPPAYSHEYSGPCQLLGEFKELRDCPTCKGNVKVKVFECNHPKHDETTIKDCQDCYDYVPPKPTEAPAMA
jgi:hypothetical protein